MYKEQFLKMLPDPNGFRLLGDWYQENGFEGLGVWCIVLAELIPFNKSYYKNIYTTKLSCRDICLAAIKANLLIKLGTKDHYTETLTKAGSNNVYHILGNTVSNHHGFDRFNNYWQVYRGLSSNNKISLNLLHILVKYTLGEEDWFNVQ